MNEIRELKFENLTTEQKLGLVITPLFQPTMSDEIIDFTFDLIKKRALGSVWINTGPKGFALIKKIRETADYPIIIMTDAESGLEEYKIGKHNALGCTGNPELAYLFGKAVGTRARGLGYNVICNPIVDAAHGNSVCGSNIRSLGDNVNKVTELAIAMAEGMHDGGLLTVAKHYPSAQHDDPGIDSHMAETSSSLTEEQLLESNLVPYLELMKRGLLDGIMTGHCRLVNIDSEYPASLSKKVIDIIRRQGFEGFAVTDALTMMGVVAKFGLTDPTGLSIAAGNDLALTYFDPISSYKAICECYEKGILTDEALDSAVKRVLATQKKTMKEPKYTELTSEEKEAFKRINRESVYEKTDDGVSESITIDGRHFFCILCPNEMDIRDSGAVAVATFSGGWYHPDKIADKIRTTFPNSEIYFMSEFPSGKMNMQLLEKSLGFEDVVFVTFFESDAYIGTECLTSRVLSVANAMQVTNRISTLVHFGNPFVVEDFPHVGRLLIGTTASDNVECAFDILAGKYKAKGVLTYDVKLN
ncbi:MAG: hypothetical protein IKU43_06515 [Clostridia bacterium]|nr:hypothetical protein [Clostridia bacterium]